MKRKSLFFISLILALLVAVPLVFSATAEKVLYGLLFREQTAPSNPPTDYGVLYTADNGGTTTLYFKDSSGTTTNVLSAGVTAWDDLTSPDANKTHSFSTYTSIFTGASTAADQWTFRGTGNFGDVSVVKVESLTGNPTDGTVLEVVSHDANVDPLVVSTSGQAGVLKVNQDGTVSIIGATDVTGAFSATGAITAGSLSVTGAWTIGDGTNTVAVNSSGWDISTTGAATGLSDVTITGDLTLATTKAVKGSTTNAETIAVQVYDVDNTTYRDAILLTNGNTPAIAIGTNNETVAVNSSDWDISTTGAMTGIGAITMDGLLTGTAGATITGAAVNLNASSNFAVNIGTGTTTTGVTVGGGSNTVAINSSDWDINTVGAVTGIASIAMDAAAATITTATDGDAQDLTVGITGATNSSLILTSSGTAADAVQINATAGGVLATTSGAMANQFKVNAAGTVAGNAIVLTTTDGGVSIDANGANNGDVTIDAASVLTLTSPNTIVINGGAAALEFEGATANDYEGTLAVADVTADVTWTLPDYTGAIPLVVGQSATQTSQAGVGTADVTGSSISMANGWFSAGKTLKYTITGTKTGANAAMIVHLYLLDATVMSLTASDGTAGDWTATFIVHEYTDTAKQKITGTLTVNGKVVVADYAAATKDMATGATTIKAQIQSQNAGDTVTSEYVLVEHWVK